MKTIYKLLLMAVFLFIGIVLSYQVKYNQLNFIIKHISFFIFFSLVVFFSIHFFYKKLLSRIGSVKKINLTIFLRVFSLSVFALSLFAITNTQLDYIKENETPVLYECYYYDEYGNNIYNSFIPLGCPDFEVISETDNSIHLQLTETVTADNAEFAALNFLEGKLDIEILVDIQIEYADTKIVSYVNNWTETGEIDINGEIRYGYISVRKEITNTYSDDSFFESEQHNYYYENEYTENSDNLYNHYDFTDYTHKIDTITATQTYNSDLEEYIINLEIEKTDLEGVTSTDIIATGELLNQSDTHRFMKYDSHDYFNYDQFLYYSLNRDEVKYSMSIPQQMFEIYELHYQKYNDIFIQDVSRAGHGGTVDVITFTRYDQ